MANHGGQKARLFKIYQILLEKTDENHSMNASELVESLKEFSIETERKSIYDSIATLIEIGINVEKNADGYYIEDRLFEMPELKLLVDAVSASKFISDKKSKVLVQKISTLASEAEAKQLTHQIIVPDKVKTDNEKIFYTIDTIYQCIDNNRQVKFQYEEWNINKEKQLKRNGDFYVVSPAFFIRNDENYYLVAYDEASHEIRHYRVDKIVNATMGTEIRGGVEERKALVPEEYAKQHVSMFAGGQTVVTIKCQKALIGVLLDKFGTDIAVRPDGDDYIRARIAVAVSPQFFGWVTGIKGTIVAPEQYAKEYRMYLEDILNI